MCFGYQVVNFRKKKKLLILKEQMCIEFLKVAQQLRELGANAQETGLVPRTHMMTQHQEFPFQEI